jgi:hypothetical protein
MPSASRRPRFPPGAALPFMENTASTVIPPRQSWDRIQKRVDDIERARKLLVLGYQPKVDLPLFVPIMVADDCLRRAPVWQR